MHSNETLILILIQNAIRILRTIIHVAATSTTSTCTLYTTTVAMNSTRVVDYRGRYLYNRKLPTCTYSSSILVPGRYR